MALIAIGARSRAHLIKKEISLLEEAVREHGRATLVVPSLVERDLARAALTRAGLTLGVAVATPTSWIDDLWALVGDGRHVVTSIERRLIMADVVLSAPDGALDPLRANPGTVRLLSRIAADLLADIVPMDEGARPAPESEAESVVFSLMDRYAEALAARSLIERCQASHRIARSLRAHPLASTRFVAMRDVSTFPSHLIRLMESVAASGEVALLLDPDAAALRSSLPIERSEGFGGASSDAIVDDLSVAPSFLEVEGPHAKARAYADVLAAAADDPLGVVVASSDPGMLFDELAPALAARGVPAEVERRVGFAKTHVGRVITSLGDLVARMQDAGEEVARSATWWPAPELSDWLLCPLSGADAATARALDKKLRSSRSLTPQAVLRSLQSAQGRIMAARAKLASDHPYAGVPCVCADVFSLLWQGRPVSALKSMLSVASAVPASAFGSADGAVRAQVEAAMATRAIELLHETARSLDIPQSVAMTALDTLFVPIGQRVEVPARPESSTRAPIRFMGFDDAALLEADSIGCLFMADVGADSLPLSREEGAHVTLAERLGAARAVLDAASVVRGWFHRALGAPRSSCHLARVTHDGQARDRYPAAIWTELAASLRAAGAEASPVSIGEGEIVRDLDPSAGEGMGVERVRCLPPQTLDAAAIPHLVLYRRASSDPSAPLVPRQLSASQIEGYVGCPLCWFMSSRVRPQTIDAGFGNMEKGNFVHDVMHRFHAELIESGVPRVTEGNLPECLDLLREVFASVRGEHERGRTSSSGALIPHSALERVQVDEILPQLEAVVRYEAGALLPFAPAYLEHSFNSEGIEYAGRPLGGRIDRIDVDAEGHAMVIDYKHRSDVTAFKLKDPTVPRRDGTVPADDPDWIPEHTQSLIYAQAIGRSSLGVQARGALYFTTKGSSPAMRGAVSAEYAEVEPGDGRVPGLRAGFPDEGAAGTMRFDELLDRVEDAISRRLDALEAGCVRASAKPGARCAFNHDLGFERRDA
ncbi:MAG: PD-(D/E)XK nuclease family protein [Collinsella sp.]|nr:PD-(D/E)XK nuclease family protein [Collinsella sp.]